MKRKNLEKNDANTKTTQRCVIEEETEVLGVKPLEAVIDPLDNQLGYMGLQDTLQA